MVLHSGNVSVSKEDGQGRIHPIALQPLRRSVPWCRRISFASVDAPRIVLVKSNRPANQGALGPTTTLKPAESEPPMDQWLFVL